MANLDFTRREFLLGGNIGIFILFAGCGSLNRQKTTHPEEMPSLQRVTVRNHDEKAHTVDVVIERDDTIIYWEEFTIRGMDSKENITYGPDITPPTFESTPGMWVIAAHLDGESVGTKFDLAEASSTGCFDVMIQIKEDNIEFFHDTPECSI